MTYKRVVADHARPPDLIGEGTALKRKKIIVAVATTTLAAAGLAVQAGVAAAGHTNTVLEASLDGHLEVANGASNNKNVGDPDGGGGHTSSASTATRPRSATS